MKDMLGWPSWPPLEAEAASIAWRGVATEGNPYKGCGKDESSLNCVYERKT